MPSGTFRLDNMGNSFMPSGLTRHTRAILFLAMWAASLGLPLVCYSAAADQDTRMTIQE
jgi:hypothetical protein